MFDSKDAAQWAVRAAINRIDTHLTSDLEQTKAYEKSVENHVTDFCRGLSASEVSAALALTVSAVACVGKAYSALSQQLQCVKDLRSAYKKEREAKTATFILPDKEESDLSNEEKFIKHFIDQTQRDSLFATYAGIHEADLGKEGHFFSTIPTYSVGLDWSVSNITDALSKQRRGISRYLQRVFPHFLDEIDKDFQKESRFASFFKKQFQGNNYLNDHRAARFMMTCLANILWNLRYPVDPKTGYPLTLEQCDQLCDQVEQYLRIIMASAEHEQPPYLSNILLHRNRLISFVNEVLGYVIALRKAYREEKKQGINITDITTSAHQVVEIINKDIFYLIYQKRNPITQQIDNTATDQLLSIIEQLNHLLAHNPKLIQLIDIKALNAKQLVINNQPTTLMDGLIIFLHMPKSKRYAFITKYQASDRPRSERAFAEKLDILHKDFIRPVEKKIKNTLMLKSSWVYEQDIAREMAKYLIPILALVIDGSETDIDQPFTAAQKPLAAGIMQNKQQLLNIKQSLRNAESYYRLTLRPLLDVGDDTHTSIDQLLAQLGKLVDAMKVLDELTDLVDDEQILLQQKDFVDPVLACVRKIDSLFEELSPILDQLHNKANLDTTPLNITEILAKMSSELKNRLKTLDDSITEVEKKVTKPNFINQQKQAYIVKMTSISKKTATLLEKESGLEVLIAKPSAVVPIAEGQPAQSPQPSTYVDSNRVIALSQLAHECLHNLSMLSWWGYKWTLLKNLVSQIDSRPQYTEEQFTQDVKKLVRIVLSSSKTYFFQAQYAQTNSSLVLVKALQDTKRDDTIKLSLMLFGSKEVKSQSKAEIIQQLVSVGKNEGWESCVEQIKLA